MSSVVVNVDMRRLLRCTGPAALVSTARRGEFRTPARPASRQATADMLLSMSHRARCKKAPRAAYRAPQAIISLAKAGGASCASARVKPAPAHAPSARRRSPTPRRWAVGHRARRRRDEALVHKAGRQVPQRATPTARIQAPSNPDTSQHRWARPALWRVARSFLPRRADATACAMGPFATPLG